MFSYRSDADNCVLQSLSAMRTGRLSSTEVEVGVRWTSKDDETLAVAHWRCFQLTILSEHQTGRDEASLHLSLMIPVMHLSHEERRADLSTYRVRKVGDGGKTVRAGPAGVDLGWKLCRHSADLPSPFRGERRKGKRSKLT